ncbi:uncharacterized protein LW93_14944 [Fusarium fujikuroi]|nr:uncharacterized protein LW93_14944 [Fusarium fujikuroi]
MPIIKRWASTNAVDTEKLVFRHEFPVKRFCRMEKLRDALGDIFGLDEWVVEYDGDNLVIKVGSRVDLKKELKARGIIYKSMCTARASLWPRLVPVIVHFPAVAFESDVLAWSSFIVSHHPLHATLRDAVPAARSDPATAMREPGALCGPSTVDPKELEVDENIFLIPTSSPQPTTRRLNHDWPAITGVAFLRQHKIDPVAPDND